MIAMRTCLPALCWIIVASPVPSVLSGEVTQRTIQVYGTALVTAEPDHAVLSFAVETQDIQLDKAKQENDERVRKVLAFLEASKVKRGDVQTSYIDVSLIRPYNDSSKPFYGCRKTFSLIVRDLKDFERLFNGILGAGANGINDVQFVARDQERLERQAREKALAVAKDKASQMAGALGHKVGPPCRVEEHPRESRDRTRLAHAVGGSAAEPTVVPGMVTVDAGVTVTFELIIER